MDLKPSCPSLIFDAACAYLHHSEALDDMATLQRAIHLFEQLPNIDPTDAHSIGRLLPWASDIQDKFHVPTRQLA